MYFYIQVLRWNVVVTLGRRYEYLHGLTPFDLEIELERLY
jgi:hypothetical protein